MNPINGEQHEKSKILITDDSEMNRAILAEILGDSYEIMEAENGVEAIAMIQKYSVELSLILLDIVMPEMDGFGVLNAMNKNHWIDDIPVIIISAESAQDTIEQAYELGVTDFISRPFDAMIVRRRVVNTILLYGKQKKLVGLVADQIYEKEQNNRLMIDILSHIVGFNNGESALHVLHVRNITEMLLNALVRRTDQYHLTWLDISSISVASALHDIGKLGIPNEILNKPGKLTEEEFRIIKTHSAIGAEILEDLPIHRNEPLVKSAREICRWHHERWDGHGYPDGLKGDEIPISAQIVAIADVYDALVSKRVYKDAYAHENAIHMILEGECGAFNPILLDCLRSVADTLNGQPELHSGFDSNQLQMRSIAEEMMHHKELTASERALRLLERERIKNSFFAKLTHEIQFEYTTDPAMVTISTWGAQRLGLDEVIMNPIHSEEVSATIQSDKLMELAEALHQTTPEHPSVKREYLLNCKGESRWFQLVAMSMWTAEDAPLYTGCIGKVIDIHDSRVKLNDLERKASHDALTGLYNHAHARALIQQRMVEHPKSQFALVMFDLDYFKEANDTYGHQFGDRVLLQTAEKLRQSIRGSDIAARAGGDEFLIFLEYKNELEPIIARIFSSLCGKVDNFQISISMGISKAPDSGIDYETFFHQADQALYLAKQSGRGQYFFYNDSMSGMLSSVSPIESDEKVSNSQSTHG